MRYLHLLLAVCACHQPAESDGTQPDAADSVDAADTTPDSAVVGSVIYPRGCYAPWGADRGPVSQDMLDNSGLVGVAVTLEWRQVEHAGDNQFDWTDLDARVAELKAAHKKILIGVVASAAKAPDWLVAMPEVTKHDIVDPNAAHGSGGDVITVVPFWDPTFRAQKLELIRAAGQHFAGDPDVVGVMAAFANYFTNDWAMPLDMKDANYSYSTMLDIAHEVLDTTATAFPNQSIKLPLGKNDPDMDQGKTATQMALDVLDYVKGTSYYGRFYAQKNLVNTNSPMSTDPRLVDPSVDSNDFLFKVLRDMSPHMGLQMVASATGGPADGCRQNAHVTPCDDIHAVLDTSIDISLSYKPTFLEFWTADAVNPQLRDLFVAATNTMIAQ